MSHSKGMYRVTGSVLIITSIAITVNYHGELPAMFLILPVVFTVLGILAIVKPGTFDYTRNNKSFKTQRPWLEIDRWKDNRISPSSFGKRGLALSLLFLAGLTVFFILPIYFQIEQIWQKGIWEKLFVVVIGMIEMSLIFLVFNILIKIYKTKRFIVNLVNNFGQLEGNIEGYIEVDIPYSVLVDTECELSLENSLTVVSHRNNKTVSTYHRIWVNRGAGHVQPCTDRKKSKIYFGFELVHPKIKSSSHPDSIGYSWELLLNIPKRGIKAQFELPVFTSSTIRKTPLTWDSVKHPHAVGMRNRMILSSVDFQDIPQGLIIRNKPAKDRQLIGFNFIFGSIFTAIGAATLGKLPVPVTLLFLLVGIGVVLWGAMILLENRYVKITRDKFYFKSKILGFSFGEKVVANSFIHNLKARQFEGASMTDYYEIVAINSYKNKQPLQIIKFIDDAQGAKKLLNFLSKKTGISTD